MHTLHELYVVSKSRISQKLCPPKFTNYTVLPAIVVFCMSIFVPRVSIHVVLLTPTYGSCSGNTQHACT